MRTVLASLAFLVALAIGIALYRSLQRPTAPPGNPTAGGTSTFQQQAAENSDKPVPSGQHNPLPATNALEAPTPAAVTLTNAINRDPLLALPGSAPPALPPGTILENMRTAIRLYGSTFNGNPVGTNEEITRTLNGGNPKQIKFLKAENGMRINSQGELIDSWGTPFFFHQLSGTEMEIRSAGPDKVMWTADDLVTK